MIDKAKMEQLYSRVDWEAPIGSRFERAVQITAMMRGVPFTECLGAVRDKSLLTAVLLSERFSDRLLPEEKEAFLTSVNEQLQYVVNTSREDTPYALLAECTATALHLGQHALLRRMTILANLIHRHGGKMADYPKMTCALIREPFFTIEQICSYFLLKFTVYDTQFSDDDTYRYPEFFQVRDPIPRSLRSLFFACLEKNDFNYLYNLSRIFPSVTMEQLKIIPKKMMQGISGERLNPMRCIAFTAEMFERSGPDTDRKISCLTKWEDLFAQAAERIGNRRAAALANVYGLCRKIWLAPQRAAEFLSGFTPQEMPEGAMENYIMKDAQEKVFDALLRANMADLSLYISKMDDNNVYRYIELQDYPSSSPSSFAEMREIVRQLKALYAPDDLIRIFFNSKIRNTLPLTDFLRVLYEEEFDPNGTVSLQEAFSAYRFFGDIYPDPDTGEDNNVLSYSFRNDHCRIACLPRQKNGALISDREMRELQRSHRIFAFSLSEMTLDPEGEEDKLLIAADLNDPDANSFRHHRYHASILKTEQLRKLLDDRSPYPVGKICALYGYFGRKEILQPLFDSMFNELKQEYPVSLPHNMYIHKALLDCFLKRCDVPEFAAKITYSANVPENSFRGNRFLTEGKFRYLDAEITSDRYRETAENILQDYLEAASHKELDAQLLFSLYRSTSAKILLPLDRVLELLGIDGSSRIFTSRRLRLSGIAEKAEPYGPDRLLIAFRHVVNSGSTIPVLVPVSAASGLHEGSYCDLQFTGYDRNEKAFLASLRAPGNHSPAAG